MMWDYSKIKKGSRFMGNKPKYQHVKDTIIAEINAKRLKIGDKLPSEIELQEMYNVSRHTIRVALEQLEHEGFIEKEHGLGSFVKLEKKERNKTIGVITTYMSDYIFPEIIRGIESELTKAGYSMLLVNTNNDIQTERKALKMMLENQVEGIIVEPTKSSSYNPNIDVYLNIRKQEMPLISINAKFDEINFPFIGMNDLEASYVNTEFLIENNHEKIGAILKSDYKQGKERLKGFVKAISDYSLSYSNQDVVMFTTETRGQVLMDEVHKLLDRRAITGLVCYNDMIALDVLNLCLAKGIRVPEDLSIVSFDNSILSMLTSVKITSISHPQIGLGIDAARHMMKMIEDKTYEFEDIVYPVNLDIKESVKQL